MVRHEGAIPVFPKRQRQAVKRLIRSVPDVLGADGKMVQLGDDAYRCFTGRSKGGGRYSPSATSDSKVEESRSGITNPMRTLDSRAATNATASRGSFRHKSRRVLSAKIRCREGITQVEGTTTLEHRCGITNGVRESLSPFRWIGRLSPLRWASAERTRKPWTTIEHVRSLLRPFFGRAMGSDLPTLASSIAYATVLSVFPLLIGLIAVLSRFVQRSYVEETVLAILAHYLPPVALEAVHNALEAVVPTSGTAGALALGGLLWSATAMASAMRHGLNQVLGVTAERPFWQRKVVELALIMLAGALLGLDLIASALRGPLLHLLASASSVMFNIPIARVLAAVSSWLLVWLAYVIVYRFLPNVRVAWGNLLWGTLVSVPLFEAVQAIFFWYLRVVARYPIVYGPLVGFVVFMVWAYLLALVLLVGAQVIAMLEERRRAVETP